MTDETNPSAAGAGRGRWTLSQETTAILTVGLALAALIVSGDHAARTDAAANRASFEAAIHAMQQSADNDRNRTDAALRAMHEAAAADRRRFEAEILRLTEGQARLATLVESERR